MLYFKIFYCQLLVCNVIKNMRLPLKWVWSRNSPRPVALLLLVHIILVGKAHIEILFGGMSTRSGPTVAWKTFLDGLSSTMHKFLWTDFFLINNILDRIRNYWGMPHPNTPPNVRPWCLLLTSSEQKGQIAVVLVKDNIPCSALIFITLIYSAIYCIALIINAHVQIALF